MSKSTFGMVLASLALIVALAVPSAFAGGGSGGGGANSGGGGANDTVAGTGSPDVHATQRP